MERTRFEEKRGGTPLSLSGSLRGRKGARRGEGERDADKALASLGTHWTFRFSSPLALSFTNLGGAGTPNPP